MRAYCRLWLAAPLKHAFDELVAVSIGNLLPTLVGSPIEAFLTMDLKDQAARLLPTLVGSPIEAISSESIS